MCLFSCCFGGLFLYLENKHILQITQPGWKLLAGPELATQLLQAHLL